MACQGTQVLADAAYGLAAAGCDATAAISSLKARLAAAASDGDIDALPALYAHRAVWYLQSQMVRAAAKDLQSALKMQPSGEAALELRVLLVRCHRELKQPELLTQQLEAIKRDMATSPLVSAVLISQIIACLSDEPLVEAAPNGATPVANGSANPAPSGGSTATTAPNGAATPPTSIPAKAPPTKAAKGASQQAQQNGVPKTSQPEQNSKPKAAKAKAPEKPIPSTPLSPPERPVTRYGGTTIEDVTDPSLQPSTSSSASTSAPSSTSPVRGKAAKKSASVAAAPSRPTSGPRARPAGPSSPGEDAERMAYTSMGMDPNNMSGNAYLSMMELNKTIGQCIEGINAGKYDVSEGALGNVLRDYPKNFSALVARGTCRALNANLAGADADFSAAIEIMPDHADTYKRRSQARCARCDIPGALADLESAITRTPSEDAAGQVELFYEYAMMQHKQKDYRRAREGLEKVVAMDPTHRQALSALGLACTAMGDIEDGIRNYTAALKLDDTSKEVWINVFQCYKESGQWYKKVVQEERKWSGVQTRAADEAFLQIIKCDKREGEQSRSMHSYRMMGHMRQCMGQHQKAVDVLTAALAGRNFPFQRLEITFLRGACNHALGKLKDAHADYEACMNEDLPPGAASETRQFQALAYYQRELAVYLARVQDKSVVHFCIDKDLDPMFKEHWSRQVMPSKALLDRCPPLLKPTASFPAEPRPFPSPAPPKDVAFLVRAADSIGELLQYSHQGFLNNARQQRAAGLAAIELAQRVLRDVGARATGGETFVDSSGASGGAGGTGRHAFHWRDAMDVAVRWRQIAEPNDQVLWVDLLTKEEFAAGFGSHTPMFSGQTKCVRYYMNFSRALNLHRTILLDQGFAYDQHNKEINLSSNSTRDQIQKATTAQEMYKAIKSDSWVLVKIKSAFREGHTLEGTRLTLTRLPPSQQPEGHEFSIRTPVTPHRWADFDIELGLAWTAICDAYVANDHPKMADSILLFTYYWYNFMPLARGSAAVGYTTILSLFWAFGMPISVAIPKDYQTDWEAILTQDPNDFLAAMRKWMLPRKALAEGEGHSSAEKLAQYSVPDELPDLLATLGTIRKRFAALNSNPAAGANGKKK